MKRNEFYKEYYKITNRRFCDHTIWSARDREKAWQKGQHTTSKTERKIFMVAQYIILLLSVFLPWIEYRCSIVGMLLFVLISFITDFSLVKAEILYHIFARNGVYGRILHQVFLGEADHFLNEVKASSKWISGFTRKDWNKLTAKYLVMYTKRQHSAMVQFRPTRVVVQIADSKYTLDDSGLSEHELAQKIAALLNVSAT